jgi:hypothetical protein
LTSEAGGFKLDDQMDGVHEIHVHMAIEIHLNRLIDFSDYLIDRIGDDEYHPLSGLLDLVGGGSNRLPEVPHGRAQPEAKRLDGTGEPRRHIRNSIGKTRA